MDSKQQLRIVCISDTHCRYHQMAELPAGDILIHCGDFTQVGTEKEILEFVKWLDRQTFKHKIVIAGNHDVGLDQIEYETRLKRKFHGLVPVDQEKVIQKLKQSCHYLVNEAVTIEGYKFWGSPYSLEFCSWAFELWPKDAKTFWEQIDKDSDVIITHGPPYSYGDTTVEKHHVGDVDLLNVIKEIRPKYHLFGHIHESYGSYKEEGDVENPITFVNCSTCTYSYKATNPPVVLTLPVRQQQELQDQ